MNDLVVPVLVFLLCTAIFASVALNKWIPFVLWEQPAFWKGLILFGLFVGSVPILIKAILERDFWLFFFGGFAVAEVASTIYLHWLWCVQRKRKGA